MVGDFIKAKILTIDDDTRWLVLNIKGYLSDISVEYAKETYMRDGRELPKIGDKYGDALRLLAKNLISEETKRDKELVEEDRKIENIIIIEDEENQRVHIRNLLKDLGYENIDIPNNKFELHELLNSRKRIDLILLDKRLDSMDWEGGVKYAEAILSMNPDAHILVITGEGKEEAESKLKHLDIAGIIIKPVNEEMLQNAIYEVSKYGYLKDRIQPSQEVESLEDFYKSKIETILSAADLKTKLNSFLRDLQKGSPDKEKVIIFYMDPITKDVSEVASAGFEGREWGKDSYNLRFSPVADVITEGEKIFQEDVSIRRRKFKNLVPALNYKSCIGLPICIFGEINHALFLFNIENSFSIKDYQEARQTSFIIERLMEKDETEKMLMGEHKFSIAGRLYSALAHEIKNVIGEYSGFSEALVKRWDSLWNEKDDQKRNQIRTEIRKLMDNISESRKEINELFEFYSELGKEDEKGEGIDINKFIEETVKIMKKIDVAEDITINFIRPSENIITRTSRIKLEQVFKNIILNACQQMKLKGTIAKNLDIVPYLDTSQGRETIKIEFRDSGPGIHRRDFERIFEPLYSTRKKGMGFGLYICKLLLESLGGKIGVKESFIMVGSTFLVEIPKTI